MTGRQRRPPLGPRLERLYHQYDLAPPADPIHRVRPFPLAADREVVGFCAAALAFGRVASILDRIDELLAIMGPSPSAFVAAFDPGAQRHRFHGFVHRWLRGDDLVALLWILRHMLETSGSIESFFVAGDDPEAADVGPGIESFSARALGVDVAPAYGRRPRRPGVAYFFTRPSGGSACKRLNLFLRWMVRRDRVDLGVWSRVSPSRLVVPLDTHVVRVGRCLGLTRYRSPGWRMAADITATLRQLAPADPVRYDFALCHVGMHGLCGAGAAQSRARCPLCRWGGNT